METTSAQQLLIARASTHFIGQLNHQYHRIPIPVTRYHWLVSGLIPIPVSVKPYNTIGLFSHDNRLIWCYYSTLRLIWCYYPTLSTLHLGKKRKSSDKKALLTAGSEWPDMSHGGTSSGVPLSPLTASQGSPPASTEAVVMVNEGAADAPTDPAPPSQL